MRLTGVHLLLTYECTLECDHCFVWSGPRRSGTLTLKQIRRILDQARELGSVEWIYFEGGEPFLYSTVLLRGVEAASRMGFQVGIVSNAYWATDEADATAWLEPFAGLVQDLSVSNDLYHGSDLDPRVRNARRAAEKLGIPLGVISIAQPEAVRAAPSSGKLPEGESAVMYRGRAAETLAAKVPHRDWSRYTECPHEDLREPGRVHVDPLGNVHICQGISLGNLFETALREICTAYDPETHPITGPILRGGPAELARAHRVPHADGYADACHLCYETRSALRPRFPEILGPDQMYGVTAGR